MITSVVHAPDCSDADCAETYGKELGEAVFDCPGCGRKCGWCMGCTDEMPELCDDCWKDVDDARRDYVMEEFDPRC